MTTTPSQCPQCDTPTPAQDPSILYPRCASCRLPLFRIADKYQLHKAIGQGGYGIVFLAQHTKLPINPMRAIKFLPQQENDPTVIDRFRREIELTAGISQSNEHIVRVFDDFGEIPGLGYFYVMEFLEGEHLYHFIRKQKEPLPLSIVLNIALQLCSGLRAAHEAGVVHRDLKPENVFLIQRQGQPFFVKIMDFGIAKLAQSGKRPSLPQAETMGTPHYMSPEQISASSQDHRADIYAFGALLFELLVGHPPFYYEHNKDMTTLRLLEHHLYIPPRKPSSLRQAPCPEDLDALVRQCMAKDPEDRPESMEELRKQLFHIKGRNRPDRQEREAIRALSGDLHTLDPSELYVPYHTTPSYEQGRNLQAAMAASVAAQEQPPQPDPTTQPDLAAQPDPEEHAQTQDSLAEVSADPSQSFDEEALHDLSSSRRKPLYALLLLMLLGVVGGWWWQREPEKAIKRGPLRALVTKGVPTARRPPSQPAPRALQRPAPLRRAKPTPRLPARPKIRRTRSRRRPRKRPRQRPVRRRAPAPRRPTLQAKAAQTPGCPQDVRGSRWVRLDLHPRSTRVQTQLSFLQRQGWICLQQPLPPRPTSLKLTARQHQPCVFRITFRRRQRRIKLRPYADDIALDASIDYCK